MVWELFQDLEGFRLDEYKEMDDGGQGMERLLRFVQAGVINGGGSLQPLAPRFFEISLEGESHLITTDREAARKDENATLLGLDHPLVRRLMEQHRNLEASGRALLGRLLPGDGCGILTSWHVQIRGSKGQIIQRIINIAVNERGERSRPLEVAFEHLSELQPLEHPVFPPQRRVDLVRDESRYGSA